MWTNNILKFFRRLMITLNIVICVFFAWLFIITPQNAAQNADGLRFIRRMSALPSQPWTFLLVLFGMAALISMGVLRRSERFYLLCADSPMLILLEILLCLMVILALHLDYNGLLLLAVVDLIDGLNGKWRYLFIGGMTFLYMLTSLDIIQSWFGLSSVSEYLEYYNPAIRQVMQSVISFLSTLNLILFIAYAILLIGQRTEENAAVRELNDELEQANAKLSNLNGQLKAYASESERMAETRERNRLAREIHDTLGHALTGITAGADACIQMLDISPELARRQMELIASTAREGMNEVRRSVKALRPDALERFQITEALNKLCEDMKSSSRAEINLYIEPKAMRLSPDEEDAVYRIVQESITNAIRHGQASKIDIAVVATSRQLTIVIQDNGSGCSYIKPGFGLRHMRERLNLLGGTLQVNGENGFQIQAKIPLRWGDEI